MPTQRTTPSQAEPALVGDTTAAAAGAAAPATYTWDELTSAALLGAQRGMRTGSLAPGDLLDAAAVLAVARRAGVLPRRIAAQDLDDSERVERDERGGGQGGRDARDERGDNDDATSIATSAQTPAPDQAHDTADLRPRLTRPEPMPADPRPLISRAAAARLRSILDGYQKYLPEWLAAARASGGRVPPVFFPELLDLTRNNVLIRADVAVLLGAPGRWLAALNRSWAFFLTEAVGPADPIDVADSADPIHAAVPHAGPGRATRPAIPAAADFTAEARRLLGRPKNSNDLYNLVMRQPGLWPEEGARLLIEYVAAHRYPAAEADRRLRIDGALPTARSSDWAIEQLQRTVGDHAPLHLRGLVRELIEEGARGAAGPANPIVDLDEILDALSFRAEMHQELTARRSTPAPPEGRPH